MSLAEQQSALVAALVGGGEVPAGFEISRVLATSSALLRKRAGEVADSWPLLAASYGSEWHGAFAGWAAGRPPNGSLRDGWDFARSQGDRLPPLARTELADREAHLSYDGTRPPTPRPRPAAWLRSLFPRPL